MRMLLRLVVELAERNSNPRDNADRKVAPSRSLPGSKWKGGRLSLRFCEGNQESSSSLSHATSSQSFGWRALSLQRLRRRPLDCERGRRGERGTQDELTPVHEMILCSPSALLGL